MQQPPRKHSFWPVLCVMLCVAVLCVLLPVSDAWAQAYEDVKAESGQAATQRAELLYQGNLFCPERMDGLSGRIVSCIESIIRNALNNFLAAFLPYYKAIVIAAMTLAVTIYGAMFMMGSVRRPAGDSMLLLFKLGAVGFFTLQFAELADEIFGAMKGLLDVVTQYVTVSGLSACSEDGSAVALFEVDRPIVTVWDKVDCLFVTLFGIALSQGMAFGLVIVLVALVFSGGIGLLIAIMALFFIATLLVAVVRAIKIYLISIIAIAFLIAVSPILIPMVLFQSTRKFFQNWLSSLLNYIMTPIFLFAFLSMIIAAYDAILFKGPSSLYYAIANQPSQNEKFSFREWLNEGLAGTEQVGRGIPNTDALTIMQYQQLCTGQTLDGKTLSPVELEGLESICKLDLATMLECAIDPIVPEGEVGVVGENCHDIVGKPYYGFLRNLEIFHVALAPNMETDAEYRRREKENAQNNCGYNITKWDDCVRKAWDGVRSGATRAFNFVWDFVKNVVGSMLRTAGKIFEYMGSTVKGIGNFVQGACRATPVPGSVCVVTDTVGGAFVVAGGVTHAFGKMVNFSGRVLMNGLMHELGNLLNNWIDVQVLDLQKLAAYHCKYDENLGDDPRDPAYITPGKCPGAEHIVMKILYVLITALVVSHLMMKWLNYIPLLGRELLQSSSRVDLDLPGEIHLQRAADNLQKGGFAALLGKRGKG